MNGRCETDPLDRAEDVCDGCYGEFCRRCLIYLPGRRHPLCTDCALHASGVRGRTKPQERGSRRTAKKRRAALAAASAGYEETFRFFDDPGSAGTPTIEPASPATTGDINSELAAVADLAPPPEGAPADAPAAGASAGPGLPVVGPDHGAAPLLGPGAEPITGPTTPAVAKLAELRRSGFEHPIPTGGAGAAPGEPPRRRATDEPPSDEPRPAKQPSDESGSDEPSSDERPSDEPRAAESRSGRRLTAPMIGQVRQIGDRRAASTGEQEDNGPQAGADAGGDPPDIGHYDTDADGMWIPPILRGMAPGASETKANLPRRRREDR
jgi:hypothetical protein